MGYFFKCTEHFASLKNDNSSLCHSKPTSLSSLSSLSEIIHFECLEPNIRTHLFPLCGQKNRYISQNIIFNVEQNEVEQFWNDMQVNN